MRHALMLAVAVGCNVGPVYRTPSAPMPAAATYKELPGVGWKVATPSDAMLRGAWWTIFGEPELDALEAQLQINNQTIKLYFENYMAARAQIRAAQSQYYPTVTTNPSAIRSRSSGSFSRGTTTTTTTTPPGQVPDTIDTIGGGGGQFTRYTVPVDISWAPDLFGRVRNTVRQAEYGAQVSAADLESQRLLAQATLAMTYFQLRGQDALQELLDSTVVANAQILTLTRTLYDTGIGTEVAVAQAAQTLWTARVQATNAGILRAQYEHAIATLVGAPATGFSLPRRAYLAPPPPIPTGAPSQLLERRPDIARAERQMAQANATIGIGYAAYFPTLTLSATGGVASSLVRDLFTWPSRVWAIGADLSQTLFDAGLRRAQIDQYVAQYNASVANYRQTVLTAFQQVEDFLAATRLLERAVAQQRRMVAYAQRAYDLQKVRFETGLDPYIDLMLQQTILLAAKQTLVDLQVQHATAAVQLVEALGGGWQKSDLPTPAQMSRK